MYLMYLTDTSKTAHHKVLHIVLFILQLGYSRSPRNTLPSESANVLPVSRVTILANSFC